MFNITKGAFVIFENPARFSPLSNVVLKYAMINSTVRATDEQENLRPKAMETDVERYNPVLFPWYLIYRSGGIMFSFLERG